GCDGPPAVLLRRSRSFQRPRQPGAGADVRLCDSGSITRFHQEVPVSKIAIVGGHGKVAMILSKLLVEQGQQVTSFFRNPEHHGDVETTGASPVVLDVERSSTEVIAEQIAGHDALIWSAGAGGGNPPRTYAVDRDAAIRSMDAAAQAGVRRYVMISYLGSDLNHGVPEGDPFFPYAEA